MVFKNKSPEDQHKEIKEAILRYGISLDKDDSESFFDLYKSIFSAEMLTADQHKDHLILAEHLKKLLVKKHLFYMYDSVYEIKEKDMLGFLLKSRSENVYLLMIFDKSKKRCWQFNITAKSDDEISEDIKLIVSTFGFVVLKK